MAPQLPPGRPGNLTAEEAAKLQEFWKAVLKVFGEPVDGDPERDSALGSSILVNDGDDAKAASINGSIQTPDSDKKSSRGFRGWRSSRESTPKKGLGKKGADTMSVASVEDKYGQTKEFYAALASDKPEEMHAAFWKMLKADHPDAILLRFLRARKWDIERALVMMVSTLHWRLKDFNMDDGLMVDGEMAAWEDAQSSDSARRKEGQDFMAQMRMGKAFLHGTDKEGRPICTITVRLHKIGAQSDTSLERLTVYTFEMARLMLEDPVDTATLVFDMTGFSLANMDYTPLKFIIKCFEANYPESLGVVLVHKAPWLFQGFWKIIRGWLDPVVASKIHFTGNLQEMEKFIARDHIPKSLGGDEDWEYEYPEPVAGENERMNDTATRDRLLEKRVEMGREFVDYTREWLRGPPVPDESLKAKRNAVATRLRENYWKLDPYIRARSMYDRNGLLGEDGEVFFYEDWHDALEQQPQ